jgi:hypothetical protein
MKVKLFLDTSILSVFLNTDVNAFYGRLIKITDCANTESPFRYV